MRKSDIRVLRVAARFQRLAGPREDASNIMTIVNPLRGFSPESKKEYLTTENIDNSVKPHKEDVRPKDVFKPTPKNMGVQNYVREGWPGDSDDYEGMEEVIDDISKDKGYGTVKNLSQYLLETDGGGGTPAVEK